MLFCFTLVLFVTGGVEEEVDTVANSLGDWEETESASYVQKDYRRRWFLALGWGVLLVQYLKPWTLTQVLTCPRVGELFSFVKHFVKGLGETFTIPGFIFGPKYTCRKRPVIVSILD